MCVPHEFVSFILKQENYNIISQPNLNYQKANNIVKAYLFEDWNKINHLKYKIAKRFELIHFIYSFLFSKFTIEPILLEFKEKTILISNFKIGERENSKIMTLLKNQVTT